MELFKCIWRNVQEIVEYMRLFISTWRHTYDHANLSVTLFRDLFSLHSIVKLECLGGLGEYDGCKIKQSLFLTFLTQLLCTESSHIVSRAAHGSAVAENMTQEQFPQSLKVRLIAFTRLSLISSDHCKPYYYYQINAPRLIKIRKISNTLSSHHH